MKGWGGAEIQYCIELNEGMYPHYGLNLVKVHIHTFINYGLNEGGYAPFGIFPVLNFQVSLVFKVCNFGVDILPIRAL